MPTTSAAHTNPRRMESRYHDFSHRMVSVAIRTLAEVTRDERQLCGAVEDFALTSTRRRGWLAELASAASELSWRVTPREHRARADLSDLASEVVVNVEIHLECRATVDGSASRPRELLAINRSISKRLSSSRILSTAPCATLATPFSRRRRRPCGSFLGMRASRIT